MQENTEVLGDSSLESKVVDALWGPLMRKLGCRDASLKHLRCIGFCCIIETILLEAFDMAGDTVWG